MNEIAARIENPSITKAQDSEDLRLLADKYPYSQLFSILYLQSLKQAGDVHFEDELKKHSFRITDRAQLFNLIESAHSVSAEPTIAETKEVVAIEEIVAEIVEEPIDAPTEEIPAPTIEEIGSKESLEESSIQNTEAPILEESAEQLIEIEKEELVSEKITEEPVTEVDSTENTEVPVVQEYEIEQTEPELVVEEPQADYHYPEEETVIDSVRPETVAQDAPIIEEPEIQPEEEAVEEQVAETTSEAAPEEELYNIEEAFKEEASVEQEDHLEQTIAHHVYAANYRLDSLTPEEEQQLAEKNTDNQKEAPSESKEIEQAENLSFTSWLQANDNYIEPEEEIVTPKVVPEFSSFDPSKPVFGEQERPKKEFFSAPKKAKKSLTEETVPVSETLAKIYTMQGNYPKAIAAYEQLMLTIPEKKSFFASLIKDLKTKLNT
ncbi:MAG: hypothetical protein AB8B56_04660 [Crocinitomicaceae bacterium]